MGRMKAVILCDGDPPPKWLAEREVGGADLFIAADGGGNTARELKLTPDLVIGDLDSYVPGPERDIEVLQDKDQETNDLEKALSYAVERQVEEVILLGASGRRLDHTLKNLSVMKQFFSAFQKLEMVDRFGKTFLLPKNEEVAIPVKPGTAVSLFPLSGKVEGIVTEGLKYPLKNEPLENGVRDGSSNEAESSPVTLQYKTGDLLVFIAHSQTTSE